MISTRIQLECMKNLTYFVSVDGQVGIEWKWVARWSTSSVVFALIALRCCGLKKNWRGFFLKHIYIIDFVVILEKG